MLEIKNLNISYKKNIVLKDVNFNIEKSKIVALMGLNGCGKTTLLKTIAGIKTPEKGEIFLDNINFLKLSLKEKSKLIGYLPQKYNGEHVTVYDTILLGRKNFIKFSPSKEDLEFVEKIIHDFNLQKIAFKYTTELSGGELQKVLIARTIAQQPKILLLDEPISHLDIYNQIEVMRLIIKLVSKFNLYCLMVIHDINTALKFSDFFIFLKDKSVYKYGDKSIIDNKLIKDVFNVNAKIFNNNKRLFIEILY